MSNPVKHNKPMDVFVNQVDPSEKAELPKIRVTIALTWFYACIIRGLFIILHFTYYSKFSAFTAFSWGFPQRNISDVQSTFAYVRGYK